jgi:predicted phage baseplate assembly protein
MNASRPGLGTIPYRIGTFNSIFAAMKDRLSSSDYPGLTGLKTRDPADWSIALLDAWAAVADVLTFYQERIANEGYVRTATERLSVLELGRTVGYALRPGVAATAYLAYTMDPTADVTIPAGTRTQSTPPQGQLPQSFETSDALHARGAWNTLGVRAAQPQSVDLSTGVPSTLIFTGVNLNLNPGDVLLVEDPNHKSSDGRPMRALVRIVTSKLQATSGATSPSLTQVTLDQIDPPVTSSGAVPERIAEAIKARPPQSILAGYNSVVDGLLKAPAKHPVNALHLPQAVKTTFDANTDAVARALTVLHPSLASTLLPALTEAVVNATAPIRVYGFRINCQPFGANAPLHLTGFVDERERKEHEILKNVAEYREWPLASDEGDKLLYLDRYYPSLSPRQAGSPSIVVLVQQGQAPVIRNAVQVEKLGRAQYGISGSTSRITLDGTWHTTNSKPDDLAFMRETQVYAQSEALPLADVPIPDAITGTAIELDGVYDNLETGRWLIVSGMRTDVAGVAGAELVMLSTTTHTISSTLPGDTLHTTLTLASTLSYTYDRSSVQIFGNVVPATNGETRTEVLGSGDGSMALQQFTLKSSPLTYVPVPTEAGVQSTLQVAVNGLPWSESDDFDALRPTDRAFVTRQDNAGNTTVMFGDGVHGARLPTGTENVVATYRVGIGQNGNVAANLLTLLANRPLGVRSVTNPLPATGGADAESLEQGRSNVPLAAAALDRIVTAADYAAVARTFAGVAKAAATTLPGSPPIVAVTIAADADETIDVNSPVVVNLESTLLDQGSPDIKLVVAPRTLIVLVLSANVTLQTGFQWETVSPAIRSALLATFGFDRRSLEQTAYRTEAIAAIVSVAGVAAVDILVFEGFTDSVAIGELTNGTTSASIVANPAKMSSDGTVTGAQLAIFKPELPDSIILQLAAS